MCVGSLYLGDLGKSWDLDLELRIVSLSFSFSFLVFLFFFCFLFFFVVGDGLCSVGNPIFTKNPGVSHMTGFRLSHVTDLLLGNRIFGWAFLFK